MDPSDVFESLVESESLEGTLNLRKASKGIKGETKVAYEGRLGNRGDVRNKIGGKIRE